MELRMHSDIRLLHEKLKTVWKLCFLYVMLIYICSGSELTEMIFDSAAPAGRGSHGWLLMGINHLSDVLLMLPERLLGHERPDLLDTLWHHNQV
jgi:hypothetical protein